MKRLFVLVGMMCLLLSVSVFAEEEPEIFTSGDYKYILLDDGTAEISRYIGEATELEVPGEVDGYQVTSIGAAAFFGCDSLSSITLPDSIEMMGANPFAFDLVSFTISPDHPYLSIIDGVLFSKPDKRLIYCPNTTKEYVVPNGTQIIGDWAFCGCESLSSITLPEGLTSIGDSAFLNCFSLSSITLPEGLTSIGGTAFFWCKSLSSITLPEGLTSIGDRVFSDCDSLTSIKLPDSIEKVGVNPFDGDLVSFTISPDHPYLTVIDDVLFSKPDKRLIYCPNTIDEYVVPNGIQIIGERAFIDCSSLSSITLPEGLKSIGDIAFYNCSSLSSITLPDSIEKVGINPFVSCNIDSFTISPDHSYLAVIDGVLFSKPDKRLIYLPNSKEEYVVPDGIQIIGDDAFCLCRSLSSITLPEGLTSIGDNTFNNCDSLISIKLPEGLMSIGDSAFSFCDSLSNITLPEGLESIGAEAFSHCSSLSSITLPEGVTSIGKYAFSSCYRLSSITLPKSLTNIGNGAFYSCESLSSITLPESVTSIGDDAFSYCADNLLITVTRGSYAAKYCKENGINYTYPDVNDWLNS